MNTKDYNRAYYLSHRDEFIRRSSARYLLNRHEIKATARILRETYKSKPLNYQLHLICSMCGMKLPATSFTVKRASRKGFSSECRPCRNAMRRYRQANDKTFRDAKRRSSAKSYARNREERNRNNIERARRNPEQTRRRMKRFYDLHSDDLLYVLKTKLAHQLHKALDTGKRIHQFKNTFGCSEIELKQHLERQFVSGMSWDKASRRLWHIDHIQPQSSFDLTVEENIHRCWHYTNLQPLWGKDNIRKGNKRFYFTSTDHQGRLAI